jgi:hypothetical protein
LRHEEDGEADEDRAEQATAPCPPRDTPGDARYNGSEVGNDGVLLSAMEGLG